MYYNIKGLQCLCTRHFEWHIAWHVEYLENCCLLSDEVWVDPSVKHLWPMRHSKAIMPCEKRDKARERKEMGRISSLVTNMLHGLPASHAYNTSFSHSVLIRHSVLCIHAIHLDRQPSPLTSGRPRLDPWPCWSLGMHHGWPWCRWDSSCRL